MRIVSLLLALPILLALPASDHGRLMAQQSGHLDATLVVDVESIAPGVPFLAAASFRMEEGWHIYWRNPGDAGLATAVEWNLPDGFVVEELGWPIPQLFGEAPEVTYGYDGTVLLPVKITPPASLAPGSKVELAAAARWLVCKEACIPGRQTVKATLPVEKKARKDKRSYELIAGTVPKLPGVIEKDNGITVSATGASYVFNIPDWVGAGSETVSFLPYFESVIDHSAAQSVEKIEGGMLLLVPRSSFATERAERLQGILVYPVGSSGEKRAVEIDVPVSLALEMVAPN